METQDRLEQSSTQLSQKSAYQELLSDTLQLLQMWDRSHCYNAEQLDQVVNQLKANAPALVSVIAQLQELADYNRTLAGEPAKYGLENGSLSYSGPNHRSLRKLNQKREVNHGV